MSLKSEFLKLSKSDLIKGSITAGIGAIGGTAIAAYNAGTILDISVLKGMIGTALAAGGSYLFKNLFTNSHGEFGKKEGQQVARVK